MAIRNTAVSLAFFCCLSLCAVVSAAPAARVEEVSFPDSSGAPTGAWLVTPEKFQGARKHCAVLFVHWYDSEAGDSNRNQYLREAIPLASQTNGCISLLIDTMWSKTTWFRNRDSSKDLENSEKQVRDLAKALDYLLAVRGVDPARVLFVGHDFGAMYGMALAGRGEKRVKAWAFQAATASFSDWFLYFPRRESAADRQAVIDRMAPLDPAKHVGSASPVLLQFGKHDRFVPEAKAKLIIDAAREPKEVRWYETGHALDEQAVADRLAWVRKQI